MARHKKRGEDERRQHLLQATQFIANDPAFNELSPAKYPGLVPNRATLLNAVHEKLESSIKGELLVSIPQIEIPIDADKKILNSQDARLLIGGCVTLRDGAVARSSFSLAITVAAKAHRAPQSPPTSELNIASCCLGGCRAQDRVVRRFHFDFQPDEPGKPASHLQYGGLFPENEFPKHIHYCLEHQLENPRLLYPPMDLVLLLDLALREFPTPLKRWIDNAFWSSLVRRSEELWWGEYWRKMAKLVGGHNKRVPVHETVYGRQ